jgi:hypothetical protein
MASGESVSRTAAAATATTTASTTSNTAPLEPIVVSRRLIITGVSCVQNTFWQWLTGPL